MSAITAPVRRPAPAIERRPHQQRSQASDAHLRVVPRVRRAHTVAYALLMALILLGSVFGVVALNAMSAANAVEARTIEARVATGEREYGRLVAEVAAREDPARIRRLALELGMVPSEASRHLVVDRRLPADSAIAARGIPSALSDPLKPILSAGPS